MLPLTIPRTIASTLKDWKNRKRKKPLLLIGNSFNELEHVINQFIQSNYTDVIRINLNEVEHNFTHLDLEDNIIDKLQLISCREIDREKSLVILYGLSDPDMIKIIAENLAGYHHKYSVVIVCDKFELLAELKTCNSLQIQLLEKISFVDFLKIRNSQKVLATMNHFIHREEYLKNIKGVIYEQVLNRFIEYLIIGSNALVVNSYMNNKDLAQVNMLHRHLLTDIRIKILENNWNVESLRMNNVLSLEKQYKKSYKKFSFHKIKNSARLREYEEAIYKLVDQGYLIRVDSTNGGFKLLHHDTGRLISQLDIDYNKMICTQRIPPTVMETYVVNSLSLIHDYNLSYLITKSKNIQPYILADESQKETYGVFIGGGHPRRYIKNIKKKYALSMAIKLGHHNISYCEKDRILSLPIFFADNILGFIAKAQTHGSFIPEFAKKYSFY